MTDSLIFVMRKAATRFFPNERRCTLQAAQRQSAAGSGLRWRFADYLAILMKVL